MEEGADRKGRYSENQEAMSAGRGIGGRTPKPGKRGFESVNTMKPK